MIRQRNCQHMTDRSIFQAMKVVLLRPSGRSACVERPSCYPSQHRADNGHFLQTSQNCFVYWFMRSLRIRDILILSLNLLTYRTALISDASALSQAPAEATRPRTWGQCACLPLQITLVPNYTAWYCVWTTCPRLHSTVQRLGLNPRSPIASPTP